MVLTLVRGKFLVIIVSNISSVPLVFPLELSHTQPLDGLFCSFQSLFPFFFSVFEDSIDISSSSETLSSAVSSLLRSTPKALLIFHLFLAFLGFLSLFKLCFLPFCIAYNFFVITKDEVLGKKLSVFHLLGCSKKA